MKKLVFVSSLLVLYFSCSKKETISTETSVGISKITFVDTEYNFGKINQGEIVPYTFVFKNDSENDLIVSNASASCGCTIPEWPKEPIKPGKTGEIKVQFNSTGKSGVQNKVIAITANTDPNITNLVLKGEVKVLTKTDSTKTKK